MKPLSVTETVVIDRAVTLFEENSSYFPVQLSITMID